MADAGGQILDLGTRRNRLWKGDESAVIVRGHRSGTTRRVTTTWAATGMTIIRPGEVAGREEVDLVLDPGPTHPVAETEEEVVAIEMHQDGSGHQRTKQRRRRDWQSGNDEPWTC